MYASKTTPPARANDPDPLGPPSPPPDAHISASASLEYWNSVPPTVNGMLGGYPQISRIDLKGSANFLAKLRREHPSPPTPPGPLRAVDCGAGIGRVTAGLLSAVCDVVDIVEPIQKFADEIKGAKMGGKGEVGRVYVMGLQDWRPDEAGCVKYDLIWNQWCLGHLTDRQLVEYLQKCKGLLREGGWIVVKENMSTSVTYEDSFDETDSTVTRTHEKFLRLFSEAEYMVMKTEVQRGFPASLGLCPVRFYALRASS